MKYILLPISLAFVVGCSTVGRFNVPPDMELYVHDQKIEKSQYGFYKRRPFSWGTSAGIKYYLKKDGKIVEQGTLKSRFRPASIFWPPVALAYWPMGFNKQTYDFTTGNLLVRPVTTPQKNP